MRLNKKHCPICGRWLNATEMYEKVFELKLNGASDTVITMEVELGRTTIRRLLKQKGIKAKVVSTLQTERVTTGDGHRPWVDLGVLK